MPVECYCSYCGKRLYRKPSAIRSDRVFCSHQCRQLADRKRITFYCHTCESVFTRTPCQLRQGTGEFCSPRCRALGRQQSFEQRFWERVQQCLHEEICLYCCWPWQGAAAAGYGRVGRAYKVLVSSRVAWELWNKRCLPAHLDAAHYCDNPLCCNPTHIYAATRKQNVADAMRAGTHIGIVKHRHAAAGAEK